MLPAISGWGGIRTPGDITATPVFKTGALNHSATQPNVQIYHIFKRLQVVLAFWYDRRYVPYDTATIPRYKWYSCLWAKTSLQNPTTITRFGRTRTANG